MKLSTICTLLIATLLIGCDQKADPRPDSSKADESASTAIMKIAVFKDGKIEIEGVQLSLEDATAQIQEASGTETEAYYFREAGQEEPHPNAMKVIAAIAEAKLPISLSTELDFSTYVDAEGNVHQRQ